MANSTTEFEADDRPEIVVGVLFSQNGSMAVTEVTHLKGTLEAYALIRTEAMNKQVTVFEMANAIINADTLFQTQE